MTTCNACGSAIEGNKNPERYPYCYSCHVTGRSYAHKWRDLIDIVKSHGLTCSVWQTGGGCMNLVVGLTEAGLDGQYALMGLLGDSVEDTEYGCSVCAHLVSGDDDISCWPNAQCPACDKLSDLELELNIEMPERMSSVEDYADWVVKTTKTLAKAVHTAGEHIPSKLSSV